MLNEPSYIKPQPINDIISHKNLSKSPAMTELAVTMETLCPPRFGHFSLCESFSVKAADGV